MSRFSDGEIRVSIGENVRGKDVFLIQSTSPPVNDNIMELLVILDALKRASAKRVTAVIPYYGYGRQGRSRCECFNYTHYWRFCDTEIFRLAIFRFACRC